MSWYEPSPDTSVRLIRAASAGGESVVDVGAGASLLADELVADGHRVTVLDVSDAALAVVRDRLADRISYVVSDVLAWQPDRTFGIWHDRAVFHFLTAADDQAAYARLARTTVEDGGVMVIGTFAPDGPVSCSGLPTARHDISSLATIFGEGFTVEHVEREEHQTPWGAIQPFTWAILRRGTGQP